tara:strand:- start:487 stop:729 length:243 start_codon:yes stop_codon:yes gene_type:complete
MDVHAGSKLAQFKLAVTAYNNVAKLHGPNVSPTKELFLSRQQARKKKDEEVWKIILKYNNLTLSQSIILCVDMTNIRIHS